MSGIPVTDGIGKTLWAQGEDEVLGLEIQIPMTLPDGVRPRDLTVEIKDGEILCVRHGETRILQWRLYSAVKEEVEWRIEDENTLVVDLEKRSGSVWSCLLSLPMKTEDALFTQFDEIDRMFRAQLPSLPPIGRVPKADGGDAEEEAEETEGEKGEGASKQNSEDDLDKLLEEAAEEAVQRPEVNSNYGDFIKAELDNYKEESEEITKKLAEVEGKLIIDPSENEATETAKHQREILSEMLRLHNECRELRSKPSALATFLEYIQVDIRKALVNIGVTGDETEEYADAEEKAMFAPQLMARGLALFGEQDIKGCLHFLRLAAINKSHDQSTMLLYDIYSQLQSPRGSHLLLRRALDEENPSAAANHKVGELFDGGARHFLPLFPAALYFYQRAAKLGHVNSMLSLAQLWLRGATDSTLLSEEETEAQRSIAKYHSWLQKAIDRGCGSAYFVRGCMHIKGEHGVPRSYEAAKANIEAAASAQPEIIRRAPQILQMLDAMRLEEAEEADAANPAAGAAAAPTTTVATRATTAAAARDDEDLKVTASQSRLSALAKGPAGFGGMARGGGAGGAMMPSGKTGGFTRGAARQAFWQRSCKVGVAVYAVYTLSFPLRILMLPLFYALVAPLCDALPWLGNGNVAADLF